MMHTKCNYKTFFFHFYFLNIHVYVLVLKEKQCSLAICNMYSKPSNLVNSVSALFFRASFSFHDKKRETFMMIFLIAPAAKRPPGAVTRYSHFMVHYDRLGQST